MGKCKKVYKTVKRLRTHIQKGTVTKKIVVKTASHNHDSDILGNFVKLTTRKAVKRSADVKPREILTKLVSEIEEKTGGIGTDQLPSQVNFAKMIHRKKNTEVNLPPGPKNWEDLWEILEELTKSKRGESFLLANEQLEDGSRILGFSSDTAWGGKGRCGDDGSRD